MHSLIRSAISHNRTVLLVLVLLLITGSLSYLQIPKEAEPDVDIPIIAVSVHHEGISADDAERLLVRPLEQELRGVNGIKEMRSTAVQSHATIVLEFVAGFDNEKAKRDIRDKVDLARTKLPQDSDEPVILEFNMALFPIIVLTLSGDLPQEHLILAAGKLADLIESIPDVLEVKIGGDRDQLIELLIDPLRLESYQLSLNDVVSLVRQNNQMIAAGMLETTTGSYAVKLPGVFRELGEIMDMPIKNANGTVIRLRDVATGRRTFKDPLTFARLNGKPAVSLEISKRIGANVIGTIEAVKYAAEQARPYLPAEISIAYSQDKSVYIRDMLLDLQNNVLIAVVLVTVILIASLGFRAATLVGIAIPGSFLTGILALSILGYTINIIVLFSLIMAVGMLVDGAIVVVELADRKISQGLNRVEAYKIASQRMAWPIISSTATTLAAFAPLLFWPGMVGEFMKYLPITLILTLTSSLVMALIFIPTLGGVFGFRQPPQSEKTQAEIIEDEKDITDLNTLTGFTLRYLNVLRVALRYPWQMILLATVLLVTVFFIYFQFGKGLQFFPSIEPDVTQVQVRARGNLSIYQRDALVREVENRLFDIEGIQSIYTLAGFNLPGQNLLDDTIGILQIEFKNWQYRRQVEQIIDEIRTKTADLPGLVVQVRKQQPGPPTGKPIQLELSSDDPTRLAATAVKIVDALETMGGFLDLTDSRSVPGVEWEIRIDRARASEFGMSVAAIGSALQLVTSGVNLGKYRPDDADDEIDIRVRFPEIDRNIDRLHSLRIPTPKGAVPIAHFAQLVPVPKVSKIERTNGQRTLSISANLPDDILPDIRIKEIQQVLTTLNLDDQVKIRFKGEDEEKKMAMEFLSQAFLIALFLIAIILVTQFNSLYQSFLILTSVLFSTIGVFLGLLITGQPFGVIMCGIGIIALAGIVVNNNIVLIDTFNDLCSKGLSNRDAILQTGVQRLRPVMLTSMTTALGLAPMVIALNIDLINRKITFNSPSGQWWTQLSTAVVGGMIFATFLTLLLTPCMLTFTSKRR